MTKQAMVKEIARLTLIVLGLKKQIMQKKTILGVALRYLGTDVEPLDRIPDNVACAITVSTIIHEVDPTFPLTPSTITLENQLTRSKNFIRTTIPRPGDIFMCATQGNNIGHTGIMTSIGKIASNTSFGPDAGKFTEHDTVQSWIAYFVDKKKLKLNVYRMI